MHLTYAEPQRADGSSGGNLKANFSGAQQMGTIHFRPPEHDKKAPPKRKRHEQEGEKKGKRLSVVCRSAPPDRPLPPPSQKTGPGVKGKASRVVRAWETGSQWHRASFSLKNPQTSSPIPVGSPWCSHPSRLCLLSRETLLPAFPCLLSQDGDETLSLLESFFFLEPSSCKPAPTSLPGI